ncbi:WS/DGAT/MGAT family acyltransferase [Mycolicibacterium sp. BK556]|uniref:wax ester/triacylglycerol synthase domain-containing protein n=1 Tax=Mycobacteriaceae TaxID=1762 RepID=UPI00105F5B46|nr:MULTISPECIES: wax ester/triacylglycerol synthase domain-containing protein [Mycobacteriaceae]MBB3605860.1 WS/DGAT/MGAT family acyltransferase [Mycolicibacterium sp. BK556]MBB3635643.1 WS/DGAT/MGAT family acyltransferase [Mycolicibacterium sp. BK607]MBB3753060.1 WS/DGAT/MGAT family acyltransferase [Mycolicibacterium sp. BK634]TDO09175.1 diacylglycerol O-acyltransferase [Mycobacterium sp. BK086]
MTEFMRNSDAFTWSMEADPRLRSTVVTVVLLDRSPDWDLVRERFEMISRELPIFRQRVVDSLPPAPPRWQHVTDFDLDYHMRRVSAAEPGNLDGVFEMARLAAMADFDRARPMWECTLIEGLENGQAAVLCKFHHALTDGIGGVQIAMALFDLTDEPPAIGDAGQAPAVSSRTQLAAYRDTLRYDVNLLGKVVTESAKLGPRLLLNMIRRPIQTAESASELAASIYRTVRPVNTTGSPLMKRRSLVRRLGVLDIPMPRLREAAHRSGGALNDAFVAGVAGALRRYHDRHGVGVYDLHLTMPISLRADGDAMGGNRITLMRFDVPAGMADPARRISSIRELTSRVRHEKSLPYTQLIAGALNLMPRWYIGSILRHVDFLCSDVPGIPVQVYLGHAKVLGQYAFGPTIGSAVNVTLVTYMDNCALGIDVDTGAIPDFEEFYDCLIESFDEVLALAD